MAPLEKPKLYRKDAKNAKFFCCFLRFSSRPLRLRGSIQPFFRGVV